MTKCLIIWISSIASWCLYIELLLYVGDVETLLDVFILFAALVIPFGTPSALVYYLGIIWTDDFWSKLSGAAIIFSTLPGIIIHGLLFGYR